MSLDWGELRQLAGEAAARADEIEAGVCVPGDLIRRIQATGATRACLPAGLGGVEATPAEWLDAIAVLAEGNAAVGWVAGHNGNVNHALVACGRPDQVERLLADPGFQFAGSTAGSGTARRVTGGWEVEGRWAFESGVATATHAGGLVRVVDRGESDPATIVVMPRIENVVVDFDWDTSGLIGTGSHSVTVPTQVIDHDHWYPFLFPLDQDPECDLPIACAARGAWTVAVASAGTQLGVAARAITELEGLARDKVRPGAKIPQIEEQATIRGIEAMKGRHHAARAGVWAALDEMWVAACAGEPIAFDHRAGVRRACCHAVADSVAIVRQCVDLAGAGSIGRTHPIARCHRDGTILHQHQSTNDYVLEMIGRISAGLAPDTPVV